METKRINLISGPRNISTALMYSFANREDTLVVDEPMYAYYLQKSGVTYHPGTQEILDALPRELEDVKRELIFQEIERPVYFIKGMAHHYIDMSLDFLLDLTNVFLIRNPYELITSFSKVIKEPTMRDIGLKKEWEICSYLHDRGQKVIVLDSNDIVSDPGKKLGELCERLSIPFSQRMIQWDAGPIKEDGVWAKYWYANVWRSTGFVKKKRGVHRQMPEHLEDLYAESLVYYNKLSLFK